MHEKTAESRQLVSQNIQSWIFGSAYYLVYLTLKDLFISESCIEIKIELNFYFHTSLWCLKRFYEGF